MEELLKQILAEIKSVRFEMNDQLNEIRRELKEHHAENIKADELILRHLLELKSSTTDELLTHEHQFNVLNNKLLKLEADVDRIKHKL